MSKFKRGFATFVDGCDGISVHFLDELNRIYEADIDAPVLAKYRDDFCDELRKKYTENDSFSLTGLSNYDERPNALFQFDFALKDQPQEFKLTEQILSLPANKSFPKYQVKNDKLSNIKASIVMLSNSTLNKSIAFFQHIFPVSLLGSDKGVLNITTHKTRLVKLEQDVLKLNANFVFMQIKDQYFIENVKTLESRLHFKEVIHSRATTYTKDIEKLGLIEDLTKFKGRVDNETSFARKVVKAYKNSAVIKGKIPKDEILKFVQDKPYYSEHLALSAAKDSLKVDTIGKCKKFLELLDDDFLLSELTNRNYIARSKDLLK